MLERSVQLFKVQAMHMLDNLRCHDIVSSPSSMTSLDVHMKTRSTRGERRIT